MAKKRIKSDKLQRQVERSEKRLEERPEEAKEEEIGDTDESASQIEKEPMKSSH